MRIVWADAGLEQSSCATFCQCDTALQREFKGSKGMYSINQFLEDFEMELEGIKAVPQ